MMSFVVTLLLGCSGPGEEACDTGCDTGDSAAPVAFSFTGEGMLADCADGACVYGMALTRAAGAFELDITETGDALLYHERHTAFELDEVAADGTHTYRLTLTCVTDAANVVANETTLFNPLAADGQIIERSTWLFAATSEDTLEQDCRVTGQDTSYYAESCTNAL